MCTFRIIQYTTTINNTNSFVFWHQNLELFHSFEKKIKNQKNLKKKKFKKRQTSLEPKSPSGPPVWNLVTSSSFKSANDYKNKNVDIIIHETTAMHHILILFKQPNT